VEVAEHCGRSLGNHQGLIDKKLEERGLSIVTCSVNEHREAITDSREEHLACSFLLGSDRKRRGKLIEDLQNHHVQRNDKYPKTLVEACNLLIHWKQDPKNLMIRSSTSDGMAFANVGGEQRPPQDNSQMQCYNVRKVNKVMNIKCNAGVTRTDMVGDLPGCGEVWFNKSGIANILSLSRMEKKCRITYDSKNGKQFIVHKENGMVRRFRQSEDGLFHMDAKESDEEQDGTVLVNKVETVKGNKKNHTKAACKQATLARKLQNITGRPSARSFLNIVEKNLLKDCPVKREDALAAEDIFGPNVGSLKGKTVRQNGERVRPE
jgi:hypothetical protein